MNNWDLSSEWMEFSIRLVYYFGYGLALQVGLLNERNHLLVYVHGEQILNVDKLFGWDVVITKLRFLDFVKGIIRYIIQSYV